MDIVALAQQAIALFQQHQPWLADKVGAAVLTQTVKELWDRAKAKLGGETEQKIKQSPDDAKEWELLKSKLLIALDEDKTFAEQVGELIGKTAGLESAAISQTAQGIGINQAGVTGSQDVKIFQR